MPSANNSGTLIQTAQFRCVCVCEASAECLAFVFSIFVTLHCCTRFQDFSMSGRPLSLPSHIQFDMAAKHGSRRRSSSSCLLGLARRQGHCCSVRFDYIVAYAYSFRSSCLSHSLCIFSRQVPFFFGVVGFIASFVSTRLAFFLFSPHFTRVFSFEFFCFPLVIPRELCSRAVAVITALHRSATRAAFAGRRSTSCCCARPSSATTTPSASRATRTCSRCAPPSGYAQNLALCVSVSLGHSCLKLCIV